MNQFSVPNNEPLDYETNYERPVLLFYPYTDDPSCHYNTMISGKVFAAGNVDGFCYGMLNPYGVLTWNNSRVLSSGVSSSDIIPEFTTSVVPLYSIIPHHPTDWTVISFLFDLTAPWIPRFPTAIRNPVPCFPFVSNTDANGYNHTTNIVENSHRYSNINYTDRQVVLWSRYRVMKIQ